ncbi:MAG TPA: DPP IV N-terminal domain-containing protein [Bryobacteraceae bacterium]|nr:DPP IV N-terminal domain-containing protein [Bryobacteraceae bacterium]
MRTLLLLFAAAAGAIAAGVPYFTEPAMCPTRPEIAFVSGGDIWVAPAKGGEAHLLVSHPADESRPLYSPDGTRLAFVSTRTGNGDIYVLAFGSGELKRLTFDDGLDQLDGWSRDGRWIYFSSGSHDVGRKNDIYRVSADGGTPMPVSADRFTNEFQAAPAPDGATVAFAARGNGDQQWWRNGHSHLDESEIWLRKDGSPASYERVVDLNGRNAWPMWMPDGRQLYFMSDRGGAQNLWTLPLGGKARQVTKFATGRVLWPSISYDGKAIVFEHDFKIWQLDTKTSEAFEVPIKLVGSAAGPVTTHTTLSQFTDLALSPDAKKIAVIGHGEVFAASAKDGGDAFRVTNTPGPEAQVAWSPDSTRIAYVGERDAVNHLFLYDFAHRTETQLTHDATPDQAPRFSPDGKSIAFIRDRRELRVIDTDSKQERLVASGSLGGGFGPGSGAAWSPDGKWIAYASAADRALRNIYVVPTAGGAPRQISFLANTSASGLQWSPNGKYLLYNTGQRTETPQIARIDLAPRQPDFTEARFEDLFKPDPPRERGAAAADRKPPVKPVEIVFDGIRERITMLPIGLDVSNPEISPDGRWLLVNATVGSQQNLYLYPLEEGGRGGRREARVARQLTSTPGRKSHAQFSPDSKEVYFLEAGKVQTIAMDTRQARAVAVNAEMDVNFDQEKMAVFEEAWAGQRDNFYDPKMHGVDWNAVRRTYAPLIEGSRTPDEMRSILRLMIGELNSSHSGVSAPSANQNPAQAGPPRGIVGQLGLSFDRAEYERSGKLRITEVLPHSAAELAKIQPGEELRSVDGVAIGPHVNLDQLLEHKVDKRVVLDIGGREVTVRPTGSIAEQLYRKWVEDNRAYVAKVSGGKLGYIHMRDMSAQALTQLYLDLDADNRAKDGVVIDVRNNNGGFVNAYALDVLARRPYMTMTNRGAPAGPARTVLGQRSLELPTILLTNQHSLSDAEDFTEGYRTLKLGKVVGEPTSGWIIYTGAMELVDGSSMRMPGTRITGADGTDMEGHPRPVDIAVTRPIGESYTGKDSQLDTAVHELLSEIGKK